jgi:hypothetical protein
MFLEYVILWGADLHGESEICDLLKLIPIFQPYIFKAKPHKANDSGIIRPLMHRQKKRDFPNEVGTEIL